MNNDLISRSALLEDLRKGTIITDDLYGMGIMAGNDHAMKKIEAAPAVDAEKVFEAAGLVKEAFDMAKSSLVPVVRCEKCVHQKKAWHEDKRMKEQGFFMYSCELNDDQFVSHAVDGKPGGFCSSGERRGEA